MLDFCDCCGDYVYVNIGRDGSRLCRTCKSKLKAEGETKANQAKWKLHVKLAEENLDRCVREAAAHGMSYGKYIAARDAGLLK